MSPSSNSLIVSPINKSMWDCVSAIPAVSPKGGCIAAIRVVAVSTLPNNTRNFRETMPYVLKNRVSYLLYQVNIEFKTITCACLYCSQGLPHFTCKEKTFKAGHNMTRITLNGETEWKPYFSFYQPVRYPLEEHRADCASQELASLHWRSMKMMPEDQSCMDDMLVHDSSKFGNVRFAVP